MSPAPENAAADAAIERIGVLMVHGIGEQGCFEHLENEVRHIVRAIRRAVRESEGEARVTVQVRTSQTAAYHAGQETWLADREAPIWVDVVHTGDGRRQRIEFREVWWADLDEQQRFGARLKFWFWGLSMWGTNIKHKPESRKPGAGGVLPGFLQSMEPPKVGAVSEGAIKLHLFAVAAMALLALITGKVVNFIGRRLGIGSRAESELLAAYLGDVKLYQQDEPRDPPPLMDIDNPPRVGIRRRAVRAIFDMADAAYDRWYVLAHSLGTVVAYNALTETGHALPNYLDEERWRSALGGGFAATDGAGRPHGPDDDMMPPRCAWLGPSDVICRERLFEHFRGLLTYGSPLDKFATLFPKIVPQNREAEVFRPGTRWINVWDPTDPVAGALDAFPGPADSFGPVGGGVAIRPDNLCYRASGLALASHIRYLDFDAGREERLVDHVAEWLLSDDFPDPTSAHWLGKDDPRIAARKRSRLLQGAAAAVLLLALVGMLLSAVLAPWSSAGGWLVWSATLGAVVGGVIVVLVAVAGLLRRPED